MQQITGWTRSDPGQRFTVNNMSRLRRASPEPKEEEKLTQNLNLSGAGERPDPDETRFEASSSRRNDWYAKYCETL